MTVGCVYWLQVFYHRVGTEQSADVLCYEDQEHRDWMLCVSCLLDQLHMLCIGHCLLLLFFICIVVVVVVYVLCSAVDVSDNGRYVLLYISKGAEPRNKLFYCDLDKMEERNISGVCVPCVCVWGGLCGVCVCIV